MEKTYKFISESNIIEVVDKLSSSLGDELEIGLKKMGIDERHSVGKHYLKWDLFNKNCINSFKEGTLIAIGANTAVVQNFSLKFYPDKYSFS